MTVSIPRALPALLLLLLLSPLPPPAGSFSPPNPRPSPPAVATASSSPLLRPRSSASVVGASASSVGASASAVASPSATDASSSSSSSVDPDARPTDDDDDDGDDGGPRLGAWIPLGSASCLSGSNPARIRVCGVDLAVWHEPPDANDRARAADPDAFRAFVDACPHRLAPLSQGRVDPETGCLECPYHGWSFDPSGALTSVPQLEEGRNLKSVAGRGGDATSLPVHAAGDLLFVFLPTEVTGESWPRELLPEDHYPYLKQRMGMGSTYFARELPYSVDFLIENFMDPAHIPFAHHSMQGVREDGSPIEMTALANNFTHVEVSFKDCVRGKARDGVLSFQRPALYHFRTRANETAEYKPNLLIFVAPVEEGRCRVMMPDFSMKFFPKWLGHLGSNRFLNTDTWLHDAERVARTERNPLNELRGPLAVGAARVGKGPADGLNYVLASRSDLGPILFRKWWSDRGFADAPRHSFGPASSLPARALSRAEQIDPWRHHAKDCARCRRALRRMRATQRWSVVASAAMAIVLRNRPAVAIALVLAGAGTWEFLRKLATAIEGNHRRAEVDERSVAAIK